MPASFNSDFPLVEVCRLDGVSGVSGVNGSREVLLTVPEARARRTSSGGVDALPVYNSPEWLGLPATAEKRYLSQQGSTILRAALLLQDAAGQEARGAEEGAKEREGAWASGLAGSAEKWLGLVMVEIKAPGARPRCCATPLFRFLAREIEEMKALQATVVRQLQDLVGVCQGKLKSTHATRLLLEELARDRVPRAWCRGGPDAGEESERRREGSPVVCSVWMQHFILRCQHFAALSTLSVEAVRTSGVWLGGLLHPEAFIIAMRQLVAQERGLAAQRRAAAPHAAVARTLRACGCHSSGEGIGLPGAQSGAGGRGLERGGSGALGCHPVPAGRGVVRMELREGGGGDDDPRCRFI